MADTDAARPGITRRGLLVGGGVGVGLIVGWAVWPRSYKPNLIAAEGEHVLSAWLKIGEDGQVVIAVPQSELGQGVSTLIPQMVAGELGADWRTVAAQPALPNPLFANQLLAREWASAFLPVGTPAPEQGNLGDRVLAELARRNAFIVTAGSTSVRGFEGAARGAGATARAMLCAVAARRWKITPEECETENGFVIAGQRRIRFADLAVDAAREIAPDPPPLRASPRNALSGTDQPRLDIPSKIDGSANFAGDIRLPDMLYASIRHGPHGRTRLTLAPEGRAKKTRGFVSLIKGEDWVAATANSWWAAEQALVAVKPEFQTEGGLIDSAWIDQRLDEAVQKPGPIVAKRGDPAASFSKDAGTRLFEAEYRVAPAMHAPIETRSCTARVADGRAEIWLSSQAPEAARQAVASALGFASDRVTLYPMLAGGSFGRNLDNEVAVQAALIARDAQRPVQLVTPRHDDIARGPFRPPVLARLTGALDIAGNVVGLAARYGCPSSSREIARRLSNGDNFVAAIAATKGETDPQAIEGAEPLYTIPNLQVSHHPVDAGIPSGYWRSHGHSFTAFITESFIDELAVAAGREPLSFRIGMLSGQPRLARCLTGVAAMAGWDGGAKPGSRGTGMGLACHAMRGGYIAVIVSASTDERGIRVRSIAAMVDAGRLINPDIARQQIEGGIVFGLAQALGASSPFERGKPVARRLADLSLPVLADVPDIAVEFVRSDEEPGGVSEIGVPAVAPAIAAALRAAAGVRLRELPLLSEGL